MKVSSRVVFLSLSAFFVADAFVHHPCNKLFVGTTNQVNKYALFAEQEEETTTDETTSVEETAEEEEEPQEDPEVTALKEEIASLESDLKAKRSNLNNVQENVERYTQGGYARRVAQMEDMKRIRLSMQSNNKDTAKAGVVQNFLPVLEELDTLKVTYKDDEFGSKYSGLTGDMRTAFTELGVSEYTVNEGDDVNPQRMEVVEEEYSDQLSKGTVIRADSVGIELAGNVMQLAKVVASLGKETSEEDASSEDEGEESEGEASE